MTFREDPQACQHGFNFNWDYEGRSPYIDITDENLFSGRETLRQMVVRWRQRFLLLSDWLLESATQQYGKSFLKFSNFEKAGLDEFSEDYLEETQEGFEIKKDVSVHLSAPSLQFLNAQDR
jgi:hypothetical protein